MPELLLSDALAGLLAELIAATAPCLVDCDCADHDDCPVDARPSPACAPSLVDKP